VQNVVNELSIAKYNYGIGRVLFTDDCFGIDKNWLEEFSRRYKEEISPPLVCIMQPRGVTAEAVACLKAAGCREIEIGVQTWGRDMRESMRDRYAKDSDMERAVNLLKKNKNRITC